MRKHVILGSKRLNVLISMLMWRENASLHFETFHKIHKLDGIEEPVL